MRRTGPSKSLPQHAPAAVVADANTPWKNHRLGLPLERPLQSYFRNYVGSAGSLLAYLQEQEVHIHVLVFCMQRQDLPPGDPGNAAPGFAKVLVWRKTCRQKTSDNPIHSEGNKEAALFKNGPQVQQYLLFHSCNC